MNPLSVPPLAVAFLTGLFLGLAVRPFTRILKFAKYPVRIKRSRRYAAPVWMSLAAATASLAFVIDAPSIIENWRVAAIMAGVPAVLTLALSFVPVRISGPSIIVVTAIALLSRLVFVGFGVPPLRVADLEVRVEEQADATIHVRPRQGYALAVPASEDGAKESTADPGIEDSVNPDRAVSAELVPIAPPGAPRGTSAIDAPGLPLSPEGLVELEYTALRVPYWAWWWPGPVTVRLTAFQDVQAESLLSQTAGSPDEDSVDEPASLNRTAMVVRDVGGFIAERYGQLLRRAELLEVRRGTIRLPSTFSYIQPGLYYVEVQDVMWRSPDDDTM